MESLEPLAAAADPGAGPRPALPREIPLSAEEVRELRRVHLGAAAGGDSEGTGDGGMVPAALWPYLDPDRVSSGFPLFLGPPASGEPALCLPAGELLARAARGAGIAGGALAAALPRLERALAPAAGEGTAEDPGSTVAAAGAAVIEELAAGGGERETLEAELERLVEALPAGGRWVALDAALPLHLAHLAALDRLLPAWEAFRNQAASLAERLAVLLAGDRLQRGGEGGEANGVDTAGEAPAEPAAEAFGADLGELGARFIDRGALAGMLAHQRGGALEPERRQRLEKAREALARFAAEAPPEPLLVAPPAAAAPDVDLPAAPTTPAATAPDEAPPGTDAPTMDVPPAMAPAPELPGWRRAEADNVCAAAAERFDREAAALAEVVRAARLARLELAGDYDPALHGPWLGRFDWRAFSRDELLLLPPVVVWLPADLAAGAGMVALSRLLLSGRPVQVVVPVTPADDPASPAGGRDDDPAAGLAGYRFEPAYLGLSHREALVQQTAAARPLHAMEGFRRGARAARAALHVVAVPATPGEDAGPGAHLIAAAAVEGRAHPLFHYDPEAGWSWPRRFDFAGNPAPAADWPRYELAATVEEAEEAEEGAGETTLEVAFTFADFALLEPAFASSFRALPAGAAAEELVPLAEWLRLDDDETAPASLPYVWAVDGDGRLRRLVVRRALAVACGDRLDFWRTLQELSGARSEYAREAAEQVREEVAARARDERDRLEARHAEELSRAEREAAERLASRLTAMLLAPEPPAGAPAASAAAPGSGAAAAVAPALAGGDPEQVAARLLALVAPALEGDGSGEPAAPADPRVEQTAARLLAAIGGGAIEIEGERPSEE